MSKDNVIHFMPRPVAPASPAIKPRHVINNDAKLLSGFIFVPCPDEHAASLPPAYLVERLGSFGYYGKLNDDHMNGFTYIKADEYHVQSCLCACDAQTGSQASYHKDSRSLEGHSSSYESQL